MLAFSSILCSAEIGWRRKIEFSHHLHFHCKIFLLLAKVFYSSWDLSNSCQRKANPFSYCLGLHVSLFLLLIIHSWCIHITFLASVTSVVHRNLIYFTVTSRLITELGDRKPKQQGYNWRHFHCFQVLKWQDDVKLYLWRNIFNRYFIKCLFRIPVDCNLIRYLINIL